MARSCPQTDDSPGPQGPASSGWSPRRCCFQSAEGSGDAAQAEVVCDRWVLEKVLQNPRSFCPILDQNQHAGTINAPPLSRLLSGQASRARRCRVQTDFDTSRQMFVSPTQPRSRQCFYLFTLFLVQPKVSDGDGPLFPSLSAILSRPCDHFPPAAAPSRTCLRARREYSTAQFDRSSDEGSQVIPVLFPCMRNITVGLRLGLAMFHPQGKTGLIRALHQV